MFFLHMLLIKDLRENDEASSYSVVQKKQSRSKRNGEPYLRLVLGDKSGKVEARIWNNVDEVEGQFEEGDFVRYTGRVELYNGSKQVILNKVEKVEKDLISKEMDLGEFFPASRFNLDEMWKDVQKIVQSETKRPEVRQLLRKILRTYEEEIKSFPAGVEIHHDYRGGYLEHIHSILQNCIFFANRYPSLDRDLLICGALLHDIGKIRELSGPSNPSYTTVGRLIGHIVLGRDILLEEARDIPGFPPQLLMLLEHMILSHQGQLEWGSPKRPKIPEALVLHYLDDLDAKLNRFFSILEEGSGDGDFTSYDRHLGRPLFNGDYDAAAPDQPADFPTEEARDQRSLFQLRP